MFNGLFLYQGRKPDTTELEAYFTKLKPVYRPLRSKLKVSVDPAFRINTLDWAWFRSRFEAGYNIRCIITEEGALKEAGVKGHNGFYNLDTDGIHDFYVTDIKKTYRKATKNGFKTALAYMVIHELMHGVVWQQTGDRLRAVKDVHDWVEAGTLKQHFEAYMASLDKPAATSSREDQQSALAAIKAKLNGLLETLRPKPAAKLLLPVPFQGITSAYGTENWTLYPSTGRHWGLDLRAELGTPVSAPLDGQVIDTGFEKSLGYWLQFFDGTYYYIIPHLKAMAAVRAYKQGEKMAEIGDTGTIKGVHCHLEVWKERMVNRIAQLKSRGTTITVDPAKHFNLT